MGRPLLLLPPFVLLLACASCSRGGGRVHVEGQVTLDGRPMPGVQVVFDRPDLPPNENQGYIGRTDARGRYTLSPMMDQGVGAPPGEYRVSLTTAVYDPSAPVEPRSQQKTVFFAESPPTPPERIPPAFRGGKLTFTVPPEGTDKADFALKSK